MTTEQPNIKKSTKYVHLLQIWNDGHQCINVEKCNGRTRAHGTVGHQYDIDQNIELQIKHYNGNFQKTEIVSDVFPGIVALYSP